MVEVPKGDYTEATLCFPIRGDEVLLAEKQEKIGAGLLNGFGGKLEPEDADVYAANLRELEQEVCLIATEVKKVGEIRFHNPSDDDQLKKMRVHIFIATAWEGQPTSTREMKHPAWYKISSLDYSRLIPGDQFFVPQILGGKCIRGLIEYNADWSVRICQLDEVEGFEVP